MNPHPTWNGKKTMPRPYPGQAIKRKPVPAPAKPAIPVKAPGHAARAMRVQQQQQQQQQRKAVPAPANRSARVPREIKRVAANHHQQHVAFLDGKWVGPENGKNAFTGFRGGYMVQRYDGKWVPAKEVMRGKGGKEKEVVHAGGWF
ncbi:hypothetical protein N7G274_010216 [Stereocaulon virgatum]|uniref:Uncharacterized protein n=1 Tax=Stereocaulon virgatum TaxID=373712 RepID=A0ABR3ZV98_9LECA